jgi:hypothetical protein
MPWVCAPGGGHYRYDLREIKCWLATRDDADDACGDDEEE